MTRLDVPEGTTEALRLQSVSMLGFVKILKMSKLRTEILTRATLRLIPHLIRVLRLCCVAVCLCLLWVYLFLGQILELD